MKLVYKDTQKEVKVGDKVKMDDTEVTVTSFRQPHKPASSGFVYVRAGQGPEREFYSGVIGAEWIEREDRGWIDKSKWLKPGSISSSTMRARHLIPAFMDALEPVDLEKHALIKDDYYAIFEDLDNNPSGDVDRDPEINENAEDCNYLVNEELFDALNEHCPPFHYFGSHEGDGADFGVWWCRESFEDAVRENLIYKINAGTEWPEIDGMFEYVAEVTDHGNITLFNAETKQELWSLV